MSGSTSARPVILDRPQSLEDSVPGAERWCSAVMPQPGAGISSPSPALLVVSGSLPRCRGPATLPGRPSRSVVHQHPAQTKGTMLRGLSANELNSLLNSLPCKVQKCMTMVMCCKGYAQTPSIRFQNATGKKRPQPRPPPPPSCCPPFAPICPGLVKDDPRGAC